MNDRMKRLCHPLLTGPAPNRLSALIWRRRAAALLSAAALLTSTTAMAHNPWLLPSSTILSAPQWITVDAAVANELFYFNHNPLPIEDLVILSPSGARLRPENVGRGKLRTTFDVELTQDGTYKLVIARTAILANWKDGTTARRWRGSADKFASEVPAGAQDLRVTESQSRLETFVTVKKPTDSQLKPLGSGLELVPVTHPNDLVSGEKADFRFVIDGRPAAALNVTVTPGNGRYRDKLEEITTRTDADGRFSITWPQPGMYWLDASVEDNKPSFKSAGQRRLTYAVTLEVMAR